MSGCAQLPKVQAPPPSPAVPIEIKQIINVRAEETLLYYQKESFWSKEKFSEILESKEEFESDEILSFKESLLKYDKHALHAKIEFDEVNKSTTLTYDIEGAMYKSDSYDFHWLLGDLPFDLFDFRRSEKELIWEGEIDSVPTTIKLVFPYSLDHCHEHVWPAK